MPEMGGCEAVRLFRAFEEKELAEGKRSRRQLIIGMSANSVLNVSHEALGGWVGSQEYSFCRVFSVVDLQLHFFGVFVVAISLRQRHGLVLPKTISH